MLSSLGIKINFIIHGQSTVVDTFTHQILTLIFKKIYYFFLYVDMHIELFFLINTQG